MRCSTTAGVLACVALATPTVAVFSMPWMCLERCGHSADEIALQLHQLDVNRTVFTDVAFELYNRGPNSSLVVNNLTRVDAALARLGLRTHAMVSSYPYPPEFLLWMRQLFASPQPFIDALIADVTARGISGVNIDWEPVSGAGAPNVTAQDSIDYAAFLDQLTVALHARGILASVDVATWSPSEHERCRAG